LLLVSGLSSLVAGEQKTNPEHETRTEKPRLYKGVNLRVWSKNSVQRAADSVQKKRVSRCWVKSKEKLKKILKFLLLPFGYLRVWPNCPAGVKNFLPQISQINTDLTCFLFKMLYTKFYIAWGIFLGER